MHSLPLTSFAWPVHALPPVVRGHALRQMAMLTCTCRWVGFNFRFEGGLGCELDGEDPVVI